jgi:hypothetical protein
MPCPDALPTLIIPIDRWPHFDNEPEQDGQQPSLL